MAVDRRIITTLTQLYPTIPAVELERIVIVAFGFAGLAAQGLPLPAPVAAARPPAPPGRRGRPPKARPARVAPPAAVSAPEGEVSRAAQARAALAAGPMTAPQLQEALALEPNAAHPLLARIGAKVAGEVEDAAGNVFKTYAIPVSQ